MKARSTAKINSNERESVAPCPATAAHSPAESSNSTCANRALVRAAAALQEAATCIGDLETRLQALETAIRSCEQPLPLARHSLTFDSPASTSIDVENRSHVDTSQAAKWLNRKPQTLRAWACYEDGPIRPVRINGRLAWAVADIRRLLTSASFARID